MQKVMPQFYEGLEVIQVSCLPLSQLKSFRAYLSESCYRTIRVGNDVLRDCVSYDKYEYWFNYCFRGAVMETVEF
ncbi:MAG: hypothetical protein WBB45_08660 [Cyclobacteriaceae bacterium]